MKDKEQHKLPEAVYCSITTGGQHQAGCPMGTIRIEPLVVQTGVAVLYVEVLRS